jgi:hypothetical protein
MIGRRKFITLLEPGFVLVEGRALAHHILRNWRH